MTSLTYVLPRFLFASEDTFYRVFRLLTFSLLPTSHLSSSILVHIDLYAGFTDIQSSARLATPPSAKSAANGDIEPGVSVRFGAVQDADVKMTDADADARGVSKRKSRASVDQKKSYAEPESSDEDDQPLVRQTPFR